MFIEITNNSNSNPLIINLSSILSISGTTNALFTLVDGSTVTATIPYNDAKMMLVKVSSITDAAGNTL